MEDIHNKSNVMHSLGYPNLFHNNSYAITSLIQGVCMSYCVLGKSGLGPISSRKNKYKIDCLLSWKNFKVMHSNQMLSSLNMQ